MTTKPALHVQKKLEMQSMTGIEYSTHQRGLHRSIKVKNWDSQSYEKK